MQPLTPSQNVASLDPRDLNPHNELTKIECVADVSSSLNDTSFHIDSSSTNYYVWFNVGESGTDPETEGRTGIEVALSENATAADVATAVSSAIDAIEGLSSSYSGEYVQIATDEQENVTDIADVDTLFTFTKVYDGNEGDFYPAMSPSNITF